MPRDRRGDRPRDLAPEFHGFISAFPLANGGLPQSPETLSFYPPITSIQFDSGTGGGGEDDICDGTMILFVDGFAADATPVGHITQDAHQGTVSLSFSAPATRMVISSTHTCGPPGFLFFGVEIFTVDNIAFVTEASGQPSQCAKDQTNAAMAMAKVKAQTQCYAQAVASGLPLDDACLAAAQNKFLAAFDKSTRSGDCIIPTDADSLGGEADSLVASINQLVNGGASGPDICASKKIQTAGKKALAMGKCLATAAGKGGVPDAKCGDKAGKSFNKALKKCGTPAQLAPLENLVDTNVQQTTRGLSPPSRRWW